MGPHRDVTGELEKAIKRHGLKFITTFHHGFAWRYFEPAFAFDGADPRYAQLYTEAHKPGAPPSQAFQDQWLAMVNEVVGKYQPDMIWFDFELMRGHHAGVPAADVRRLLQLGGPPSARVGRGAQVPRTSRSTRASWTSSAAARIASCPIPG